MSLGRKIIFVICLIVFVGSAGMLLNYFLTGMREQSSLEDLAKLKAERDDLKTDKGTVIGKYVDLYEANSDIIGWIQVEDTKIDYPIMWTPDDGEYYLHRNFQKEQASSGVPFMDAASDIFVPTSNFLLYGHNMKNGSMFAQLKKFSQNSDIYNQSKYFWIFTPEKNYRYEIISAYTTGVNSDTYTLFKGPGEEFEKYLQKIRGYSDIKTDGGELTIKDKIVTLSTCTGNEATRYVVQGKRVDTLDVAQ